MKLFYIFILLSLALFSNISKANYDHCASVFGIALGEKLTNQIEILRETLKKSGARIFMKEVNGKIIPVVVVKKVALVSSGLVDAEWLLIDKKSLKTNLERVGFSAPVSEFMPKSHKNAVYGFLFSLSSLITAGVTENGPILYAIVPIVFLTPYLSHMVGIAQEKRDIIQRSTGLKNLTPKQALKGPDGYIFDLQTQDFLKDANVPLLVVTLEEDFYGENPISPSKIKNPESSLNRSIRAVGLQGATEISMNRFVDYLNSIKRATPDLVVSKDICPLTCAGSDTAGVYIERIVSEKGFNFDSFTMLVDAIRSKGLKFSIKGFMQEASSISVIYGMPRDENGKVIATKFTIPIGILATSTDPNGKPETRVYLPMIEKELHRQNLMDRIYYVMGKTELMSDKSAAETFKNEEEAFVEVNNNIRTMHKNAAEAFEDRERKILNPDGPTRYTHEFLDRLLQTSGEVEKEREETDFQIDLRQMRQ